MSANRRLILKIGAVLKSMGRFVSLCSLRDGDLTFNIEVGVILIPLSEDNFLILRNHLSTQDFKCKPLKRLFLQSHLGKWEV
jgi:hypothetical protein